MIKFSIFILNSIFFQGFISWVCENYSKETNSNSCFGPVVADKVLSEFVYFHACALILFFLVGVVVNLETHSGFH